MASISCWPLTFLLPSAFNALSLSCLSLRFSLCDEMQSDGRFGSVCQIGPFSPLVSALLSPELPVVTLAIWQFCFISSLFLLLISTQNYVHTTALYTPLIVNILICRLLFRLVAFAFAIFFQLRPLIIVSRFLLNTQ